jgi:DNA polymerase-3 subunit alpha
MLDGASRIKDLVQFAKEQNMPGLALTDHGVMYGAVRFYKEAKDAGIKPLMGCEVYVTADRHDRSRAPYYHLTLIARTAAGYRNLMKLSTAGFLEGFYYKPRVDMEMLKKHGEGIICLSGCLSAEVPTRILEGRFDEARRLLNEYGEIFDAVYLEMQDHGIPEQRRVNEGLVKLHKETGLDLVAANDSHYTTKHDAKMHDALLCIGTGKFFNDPNRMKFHGEEFYVKSIEEMGRIFPDHPEALSNTLKVVESVEDVGIELGKTRLPNFPKPEGYTADQYLREQCDRGLVARYGERAKSPEVQQRLEFELGTIGKMGFADYFLIVWDFVKYAKDRKIAVGPGRGSAAGSIVAYALGITDLDPLHYSLLFERFLNPDRINMPDVDIDFSVSGRSEVMKYVTEKYGGHEHVAQIITFGTIGAKAAIRDSGRIFQYPYSDTDKLAKFIPDKPVGTTLRDVLTPGEDGDYVAGEKHPGQAREIIQFVNANEGAREVLDTAFEIEGFARHAGTHAAGVVISEERLTDIVPLQAVKKANAKGAEGEDDQLSVMVQHPMSDVEALGLLKVDFLGLRNLDVIEETLETIRKNTGEEVDIQNIPLDDEKTLKMFARGDTFGVFQFESGGMQRMLQEVRPDRFDDLVALNALYRPGPMDYIPTFKKGKHDPESVDYRDERLKPILEPTYGVAAYQEQLMEISKLLGGFTPGQADTLRKAIGKKNAAMLATLKDKFMEGCAANDVSTELDGESRRLLVQQEPFGLLLVFGLPDRLPQGPLPRGVHGGAHEQRHEHEGQGAAVRRRGPRDEDRGPPAGRERERPPLHRRRGHHKVRPLCREERGRKHGGGDPGGKGRGRPVRRHLRLLRAGGLLDLQQAHPGVPHKVWRLRQRRPLASGDGRRPCQGRRAFYEGTKGRLRGPVLYVRRRRDSAAQASLPRDGG